jgi:endonuclease YncB( thermonuclease family)
MIQPHRAYTHFFTNARIGCARYATVGRTRERHLYKLKDELKEVEAEAKKNHEGMWMYGDISEDPKEI